MSDSRLRLAMAALATASAGIAAYLWYAHYDHGALVCSTGGCNTVARSAYSEIFGVPVAAIGVIGSLAILASLLRVDDVARAAGLSLTLCGLIFAAYLVIVQLAVIDAVCEWCVANDVLLTVLALLAARRAWPEPR